MSDITQNLLDTISLVTERMIAQAQFDRTIQAIIVSCEDQALGKYKVKYQDSMWMAYSNNLDAKYSVGTSVYVLLPGNNTSKTKTILGAVSTLGENYIEYISAEQNYIENGNSIVILRSQEGLCSYIRNGNIVLYEVRDGVVPYTKTGFYFDKAAAAEYLSTSEYVLLKADFRTDLPKEQRRAGNYGLKVVMQFKVPEDPDKIAEREYILDIDNMVGNPYLFTAPLTQKVYLPIDGANFIQVKSIEIFNKDFDHIRSGMPNDIFVSNIEIIGANVLTEEEKQGISLRFRRPKGYIFTSADFSQAERTVIAQIRVSNRLLSTLDKVEFYWFRQDATISAGNRYYNKYGGKGWKCLNKINSSQATDVKFLPGTDTFIIKKSQIAVERVKFKCVALYDGQEISNTFDIINLDSQYIIELTCDQEPVFYPKVDTLHLTCTVKLRNGDVTLSQSNGIVYNWSVVTEHDSYSTLNETSNVLTIQSENIRNYNNYYCAVYISGDLIGTVSMRVTKNTEPQNRYILSLINGVQVFNYDELGMSPGVEYRQNNFTIPQLSFTVTDVVTGFDVTDQVKEITWAIPLVNTMLTDQNHVEESEDILDDDSNEEENPSEKQYTTLQDFSYGIKERYSANFTNNDIKLKVLIHGIEIQTKTDLTFVKEGDSGTNGTGIICKITATNNGERVPGWLIGTYVGDDPTRPFYNWDNIIVELWQNGERILGSRTSTNDYKITWQFLSNQDNTLWYTIPKNEESGESTINKVAIFNSLISLSSQSLTFNIDKGYSANLLKVTVQYKDQFLQTRKYYDVRPIVTIYKARSFNQVTLDNTGFQYVVYSEDGENPQYDDTMPFTIISNTPTSVSWSSIGSYKMGSIGFTRLAMLGEDNLFKDTYRNNKEGITSTGNQMYFKPKATYDGLSVTNAITATSGSFWIHIPIHFMFNRYGHKQLNDWDGNSIQIDNEGGYILSPQIGAGRKNPADNSFTGLIMGVSRTPKEQQQNHEVIYQMQTGLFGYNAGQRTIFLDAETGKAEFGKQGAGRIILDPRNNRAIIVGGNYKETQTIFSDDEEDPGSMITIPGTGMMIDLTTPEIRFGSGNFIVDRTGFLTSVTGKIGPWNLVSSCMYYNESGIEDPHLGTNYSDSKYIYLGTEGFSLGKNFIYDTQQGNLKMNVNSLQLGGIDIYEKLPKKNLFSREDLVVSQNGTASGWENQGYDTTISFIAQNPSQGGASQIKFPLHGLKAKQNYILSFTLKFIDGTFYGYRFVEDGGSDAGDDGIEYQRLMENETERSNPYTIPEFSPTPPTGTEYKMILYFSTTESYSQIEISEDDLFDSDEGTSSSAVGTPITHNIHLVFNRGKTINANITINISNIMIEQGTTPSEWEPSNKDARKDLKDAGKTATNYLFYKPTGTNEEVGLYVSERSIDDSNLSSRLGGNIRLSDDGMHIYKGTRELAFYGETTKFYSDANKTEAASLGTSGLIIKKGSIQLGELTSTNESENMDKGGIYLGSNGSGLIGYVGSSDGSIFVSQETEDNYIKWTTSSLKIRSRNFILKGNSSSSIRMGTLTSGAVPTGDLKGVFIGGSGNFVVGNATHYLRWNNSAGTLTLQGNYNQTGGYINLGSISTAGNTPGTDESGFRVSSQGYFTVGNATNYLKWKGGVLNLAGSLISTDTTTQTRIIIQDGSFKGSYYNNSWTGVGGVDFDANYVDGIHRVSLWGYNDVMLKSTHGVIAVEAASLRLKSGCKIITDTGFDNGYNGQLYFATQMLSDGRMASWVGRTVIGGIIVG